MKIDFTIDEMPTSSQVSAYGLEEFVLYLEGTVTITVDEKVFFKSSGILLIEFARCIGSWLHRVKKGERIDFIYETMDYYEAPILVFRCAKDEFYKIDSIWKKKDITRFIEIKEIIAAFEYFLKSLDDMMVEKLNIKLSKFIG